MTAPENFVARWARLKSESDTEPKTELARYGLEQEVVVSVGTETPSLQQQDEVLDEPFDPASLPSIETITVDTDIRGFLHSHVPAALTRAVLRQAWASDPAIRDFIGIAENQWDFNDRTAMPGFGPLLETDNIPALLARALGGGDKLARINPEIPAIEENALPGVTGHEPANPDLILQQSPERQSEEGEICNLPDDSSESTAIRNDRFAEQDDPSRSYRSHGSALPR
jgi:Protein of unknown function (DUF3306)